MFEVTRITRRRIGVLIREKRRILRQQGILVFLKDIAAFLRRLIFSYSKRYLYEHILDDDNDIPILPCRLDNVVVKPVYIPTMTIFDYEEIGEEPFDFPSHPDAQSYEGGDKGIIVFYATVGGEFVHRSAVSLLREKDTDYDRVCRKISSTPFSYPLSLHNERTIDESFSVTNPKYRKSGLYAHVYSVEQRYLKEKGFTKSVSLAQDYIVSAHIVRERTGGKALFKINEITLLTLLRFIWVGPFTKSGTPSR